MSAPDRSPGDSPADPLSVGLDAPAPGQPGTGPSTTPGPSTAPGPSTPPGPVSGAPAAQPSRKRHPGRTIGRSLALALLLFVTVLLVLFVVFNGQTVRISLVFGEVEAPLVLALLVAAVLGGLLVWLAGLVLRARRRNR